MKDLAEALRSAAMAIIALLEFNRTGQPAPVELRQAAENSAQDLLAIARHLAAADAEAEADESLKH